MVYDGVVDKTMCTESCKCDAKYKNLYAAKLGTRPYVVATKPEEIMISWTKCLNDSPAIKKHEAKCNEANNAKKISCRGLKELKGKNGEFFPKLEKSLQCSGICKVPIFGQSRDISEGPPT